MRLNIHWIAAQITLAWIILGLALFGWLVAAGCVALAAAAFTFWSWQ